MPGVKAARATPPTLLILGGTGFIGPPLTAEALATSPDTPERLETPFGNPKVAQRDFFRFKQGPISEH